MKQQNGYRSTARALLAPAALSLAAAAVVAATLGCRLGAPAGPQAQKRGNAPASSRQEPSPPQVAIRANTPVGRVLRNARSQVGVTVSYDPEYRTLAYPNGDVPLQTGVCSDVVVRALRAGGADLQKLVHEDMRSHFDAYPRRWGLRRPDKNIDHRRVANLQTFFARRGKTVAASSEPGDFRPGDAVAWRLPGGLLHIGLVSDKVASGNRPLVIHNIGAGAREEDVLFAWPVIGHYRYFDTEATR